MNENVVRIGDPHFGAHQNSQLFLNEQLEYYEQIIFTYILKYKIKKVIVEGDVFNNRKSSSNFVVPEVKRRFFDFFDKNKIELFCIEGNHDSFHKLTNSHSLLSVYESKYIHIIDKVTKININNQEILLVPYFFEKTELIKTDYCIGHFDIQGFKMNNSQISNEGLLAKDFKQYKKVYSGHYHVKSTSNNIFYDGMPYHKDMSQLNSEVGFNVTDFNDYDKFIINEFSPKFISVTYNSENISIEGLGEDIILNDKKEAKNLIKKHYIKLITRKVTDRIQYNNFIEDLKIRQKINLEIVNDSFDNSTMNEDKIKDTLSLIKEYFKTIDNIPEEINKNKIVDMFLKIYTEVKQKQDLTNLISGKVEVKYLKFRNLLSYGNYDTVINFDKKGFIKISGSVGSGKTSAIIEGLSYNWTGSSALGKSVTTLVNNSTKKGLITETVFTSNNKTYKVIRGRKPKNIFEIYIDNELQPIPVPDTDYQKIIDNALGLSVKQLQYLILKNKEIYEPFTKMNTKSKREFIERMFSVEIFTLILEEIKEKLKTKKQDILISEKDIEKFKLLIEQAVKHSNQNFKIKQDEKQGKLDLITDKIKLVKDDKEYESLKNSLTIKKSDLKELQDNNIEKEYNSLILDIDKQLENLTESTSSKLSNLNSKIETSNTNILDNQKEIETNINPLEATIQADISVLNDSLTSYKQLEESLDIDTLQHNKKKLEEVIPLQQLKIKEIEDSKIKQQTILDENSIQIKKMKKVCGTCPRIIEFENDDKITKIVSQMPLLIKVILEYKEILNKSINFLKDANVEIKKYDNYIKDIKDLKLKIERKESELEKTNISFKENKKSLIKNNINLQDSIIKLEKEILDYSETLKKDSEKYNTNKEILEKTKQDKIKIKLEEILIMGVNIKFLEEKVLNFQIKLKIKIDILNKDFKIINDKEIEIDKKEINKLNNSLKTNENNYNKLHNEKLYFDYIREMLMSSDSIKQWIIGQYIEFINYKVNNYLSKFNVDFGALFDKNMDIKLIGGNYDKLNITNLSSGENRSLDLSLLFLFQDLQEKLLGKSFNILVLDEILGGVDINKVNTVMDILSESNKTIFIVEHWLDLNNYNITEWEVVKENGFSKIIK